MATIAIFGALDTKGEEHEFVAELIEKRGHTPLLVDFGILNAPVGRVDVTREEVAKNGAIDLAALARAQDRGAAIAAMCQAAAATASKLYSEGKIDGIISLAGGGGTAIASAAMRALPIGFPKLIVSTLASGNVADYVGVKDITMMPSIVDVAGLNRISRQIFTRAAGAICGMVEATPAAPIDRPLIVASMFGNTTECVQHARKILEQAGYEVLVFHATGVGGRTMESLIETGMVEGVLDLTTTEWADEVAGGVLSAGPDRLLAAARAGVPAVIAPGCLDMVNFQAPETVPQKFQGRLFYPHNPQVTLMRTTVGENTLLGEMIAARLNASTGPVSVLLPLKGFSVIGAPGGPFYSAEADQAFFDSLKGSLRPDINVVELDCVVNDTAFAQRAAETLLSLIQQKRAS